MKNTIRVLLILIALAFISCSKESIESKSVNGIIALRDSITPYFFISKNRSDTITFNDYKYWISRPCDSIIVYFSVEKSIFKPTERKFVALWYYDTLSGNEVYFEPIDAELAFDWLYYYDIDNMIDLEDNHDWEQ